MIRFLPMLVVLGLPLIAMGASLWPLESTALRLLCVALAVLAGLALVAVRTPRQSLLPLAAMAMVLSIAVVDWPLRFAFALSQGSFDRLAETVGKGGAVQTPCWVGVFRVSKAELSEQGVVCLWTDENPTGRTGFVQHPQANVPLNLWSQASMNASWQFVSED